jgi:hypothetical protein
MQRACNTAYVQICCSKLQIRKGDKGCTVCDKKYLILLYFIFEKSVKCLILKSTIRHKIITSQHKNVLTAVQFTYLTTIQSPALRRAVRILTWDVLTKRRCSWDSSAIVCVCFTSSRLERLLGIEILFNCSTASAPLVKATTEFSQYISEFKNAWRSTFALLHTFVVRRIQTL